MTFLSAIERHNRDLRRAPARGAEDGVTPQHSAAAAGLAEAEDDRQVRSAG